MPRTPGPGGRVAPPAVPGDGRSGGPPPPRRTVTARPDLVLPRPACAASPFASTCGQPWRSTGRHRRSAPLPEAALAEPLEQGFLRHLLDRIPGTLCHRVAMDLPASLGLGIPLDGLPQDLGLRTPLGCGQPLQAGGLLLGQIDARLAHVCVGYPIWYPTSVGFRDGRRRR